jgi:shikimate kinase
VLDPATQADLEAQRVVFLTVSPRAVEGRLGEGKRPLIRDGVNDWQRIFDERRGIYERLSDLTIDTSHRPYDSIAEEVAEWART